MDLESVESIASGVINTNEVPPPKAGQGGQPLVCEVDCVQFPFQS